MSYEGYSQRIGECGHSWNVDDSICWSTTAEISAALKCPTCNAMVKFVAHVDETNGSRQVGDQSSWPAEMKQTGFTDTWNTDHYGNKYAVKHPTYSPEGDRWSEFSP